jgi:hypothetical protein
MSWQNIHESDFGWVGKLRIVQDGIAVDISSYTTRQFVFRKPDGTEVPKTATFTADGVDGYLQYTAEEDVFDVAGKWRVWAVLNKTGSELTSAALKFDVEART